MISSMAQYLMVKEIHLQNEYQNYRECQGPRRRMVLDLTRVDPYGPEEDRFLRKEALCLYSLSAAGPRSRFLCRLDKYLLAQSMSLQSGHYIFDVFHASVTGVRDRRFFPTRYPQNEHEPSSFNSKMPSQSGHSPDIPRAGVVGRDIA